MKPKTHKLLSILLSLVMLLSLAPVSALAEPVTYTVTFHAGGNGISAPMPATQTVVEGEKATRPADPDGSPDDAVFQGWYTESWYANEFDFDTPVDRELHLYAKWNYGPGYYYHDVFVKKGTASPSSARRNTTITITANEPEAGKVFDKWIVTGGEISLADEYSATTTFTMPVTLVSVEATYKDAPATTEIPSVGLSLTLPAAGGSYSGAVPAAVSISSGTGFTVKSANWFNGGTPETNPGCGLAPTSFEAGKPYFAEICLAPVEGYVFADDAAVTIDTLGVKGKEVIDNEADRMGWLHIVTEDYTIPAATGYTVTFDANGGNAGEKTATTQSDGTLGSLAFGMTLGQIRTGGHPLGYELLGFAMSASATTTDVGSDTVFTEDTRIYAVWKAPATTYTITLIAYDKTNGTEQAGGEVAFSDSGKGTRISGDYEGNSSRTVGVYPASDYSFAGWAKGSPSGEIVSTSSPYTFTVTEDVTLYALFEKITTYPVWVGGVHVTSANKDDILGDGGKAKYDPDTNTLTLDNPTISGAYHNAAVYAEVDLTITGSATLSKTILVNEKDLTLDANIVIATPGWDCAIIAGNITVNGGSISASADEDALIATSSITINAGSVVGNGCDLYAGSITIAGGTLNVSDGLFGIYSKNDITISGGTVTAKGNDYGIYAGGSVTISGGSVTATGGENGIRSEKYDGQILISGGTVKATGTSGDGISGTCPIDITGGTVEATGGSAGIWTNRSITIGNSITKVTADGATNAIRGFVIVLGDALIIQEPAGGTIGYMGGGNLVLNGENAATHAVIVPGTAVTTYPVWVGGEQVTSTNKDDILGDGTASFDPSTNTLTLNGLNVGDGYHASGASIVSTGIDLTVKGSATLSGGGYGIYVIETTEGGGNLTLDGATITYAVSSGSDTGIRADGNISISGGTIDVTAAKNGIRAGSSLTISGGSVTATGSVCGISAAHGDVTISGGTVNAKSDTVGIEATNGTIKIQNGTTSVTADGAGAAIGAGGITIGDEMMIKEPAGGFIGDITGSRVIKNPDDTTATHVVIAPKEAATHTVTFEANGGTPVPEAQTVADGGKATKPADPTKSGVSFGGWYKDSELTEPFDFNTPITADITLYASWDQYIYMLQIKKVWEDDDDAAGKRPDFVDVKILANGTETDTVMLTKDGDWEMLYVMATGEADLELTCEEIVPEGYTLKDMTRDGDTIILTNQFGVTPPAPKTHTVTFEPNGGSAVPAQTVNDGEKATKPADPTRSGFVFDGWYADATFSAAFDFGTPITADVTIYAKWKEEEVPGEIVYTIVSGGNSTWTKGSNSGVTIVVKRNPNDKECFSHFTSVQIDGTTLVNGTDFSAVAGSTVITLNASALQKLTTGTKTVTINFDDGKAATKLTIKTGSSGTGDSISPNTGDDSKPGLWLAVMMLSGLGIGGLVVNGKKRRYVSRH